MFFERPIEWPSLRRFLLEVHLDLINIDNNVDKFNFDTGLSLTEKMILILEDRRFFRHYGVDVISVVRETLKAVAFKRHGGASTIDMQWVRTVTGYRDLTYKRKLYEMFLSLIIQQRYDKMTIFKSYMKCAYLGHRIKGLDEACEVVFMKHHAELTLDEASEVAAMFVYPRPSVRASRWLLKLERRKNYAKILYPRNKKRFDKVPRRKIL